MKMIRPSTWLRWARSEKPWLFGWSPLLAGSYLSVAASLALILFPSDKLFPFVPYLCVSAFVLGWLRKAEFGTLHLAILTIVISQAASVVWSMRMDDRARRREEQADVDQQQREVAREYRRDSTDAAQRQRDSDARDSLALRLVTLALRNNVEALQLNRKIVLVERDSFIARSMIQLTPTVRLETEWWRDLLQSPPKIVVSRPSLFESLRSLEYLTIMAAEQFDARASHIRSEGQLRGRTEGEEDPFMRRLRKLDDMCIGYSDTLLSASRNALVRLTPAEPPHR